MVWFGHGFGLHGLMLNIFKTQSIKIWLSNQSSILLNSRSRWYYECYHKIAVLKILMVRVTIMMNDCDENDKDELLWQWMVILMNDDCGFVGLWVCLSDVRSGASTPTVSLQWYCPAWLQALWMMTMMIRMKMMVTVMIMMHYDND